MPRLLPLLVIAIGGVIAVRAVAGFAALPGLLDTAKAFAEEAAPAAKATKAANVKAASPLPPEVPKPTAAPPAAICAPTAAELAREAGLSPAELTVLQNLGSRRTQLDQRETDMDVQLQLLAAAEGKVDAKLKALAQMKADMQALLGQAQTQKQTEVDRLVRVYEAMKPKDAAGRMVLLDDSIRVPMAAKMKERALSAILAQMPAADAKALTEKLAQRFTTADQARQTLASGGPNPPSPPAVAANPKAAAAKTPLASADASADDSAEVTPVKSPPKAAPKAKKHALAKAKAATAKPTAVAAAVPAPAPTAAKAATPAAPTPVAAAAPPKAG